MRDDNIVVSLTDFIDFAIRVGPPKQTKVAQVKNRGAYSPATDYWKGLRDELRERHESGRIDRQSLQAFARRNADPKKINRYTAAVDGYLKFLGRKDVRWFAPPKGIWKPSRLGVNINPELGLNIGGSEFIIKLYFKGEKLTKQRIDLVTYLLRNRLQAARDEACFAVLDVANGKLHTHQENGVDLMPLLMGEAASFVAIWESLGAG